MYNSNPNFLGIIKIMYQYILYLIRKIDNITFINKNIQILFVKTKK